MIPPISLDLDKLEDWFKDEASRSLAEFTSKIAGILDDTDTEIDTLRVAGFEDTLLDKMERDIKAAAYEKITQVVDNLI